MALWIAARDWVVAEERTFGRRRRASSTKSPCAADRPSVRSLSGPRLWHVSVSRQREGDFLFHDVATFIFLMRYHKECVWRKRAANREPQAIAPALSQAVERAGGIALGANMAEAIDILVETCGFMESNVAEDDAAKSREGSKTIERINLITLAWASLLTWPQTGSWCGRCTEYWRRSVAAPTRASTQAIGCAKMAWVYPGIPGQPRS